LPASSKGILFKYLTINKYQLLLLSKYTGKVALVTPHPPIGEVPSSVLTVFERGFNLGT